jgi:hypothetical protein
VEVLRQLRLEVIMEMMEMIQHFQQLHLLQAVEVELTLQMDQETLAVLGVEVVIILRVEMEILHLLVLHKEMMEDLLVVRDLNIQQQVVAVLEQQDKLILPIILVEQEE